MILYRRGFGLFDQENLARYFKIKVGPRDVDCFNIKLGTYTSLNNDEGLKTIESEDVINQFFLEHHISLSASAVRASEIRNLQSFITKNLEKNRDLWIEYKSHVIHNAEAIHDGLVESIAESTPSITATLINPLPRGKPRFVINLHRLQDALSDKYGRETGFIVIERKTT